MRISTFAAGITLSSLVLAGCTQGASPAPTATPSTIPSPEESSATKSPEATMSAAELAEAIIGANTPTGDIFDQPLHITQSRTATINRGGQRHEEKAEWSESIATDPFLYELDETQSLDGDMIVGDRYVYAEHISGEGVGEGIAIYTREIGGEWVKEFATREDFALRAQSTGEARRLALHLDAIAATTPESLTASCSATTCTLTARPTGEVRNQIAQSLFGSMLEAADGPFEAESLMVMLNVDADTYLIRTFDFHAAGSSEASDGTGEMTLALEGTIDYGSATLPQPIPDAARAANFG